MGRIEETNLNLGDFEASKRRMTSENADLLRQVQELNANASLMVKTKSALASALDEQKMVADGEAKERVALLGKFRNMEHMADGLRENYDEEVSAKENLARQLNKALGDADMWRQKYEVDGMAKAEELEMAKLKLQARLSEGQATIEQLNLKLAQLEKSKAKLAADSADMAQQLDQAQIMHAAMEKIATLRKICGVLKGPSRSTLTRWMRTGRTTRECRALLTSCKARSSPTRSRLRRLRRSLHSTWLSTARCRPT